MCWYHIVQHNVMPSHFPTSGRHSPSNWTYPPGFALGPAEEQWRTEMALHNTSMSSYAICQCPIRYKTYSHKSFQSACCCTDDTSRFLFFCFPRNPTILLLSWMEGQVGGPCPVGECPLEVGKWHTWYQHIVLKGNSSYICWLYWFWLWHEVSSGQIFHSILLGFLSYHSHPTVCASPFPRLL